MIVWYLFEQLSVCCFHSDLYLQYAIKFDINNSISTGHINNKKYNILLTLSAVTYKEDGIVVSF